MRAADSTLLILRTQLETTQGFQSDLLQTVYWALGGVFVLVGLLLAVGWYANFKVYRRDLDLMRDDIVSRVALEAAASQSHLETVLKAHAAERVEVLAERITSRIATIERQAATDELDRKFESYAAYRAKGTHSMAATAALGALGVALRHGSDSHIPKALRALMESINEGGKLTEDEFRSAKERLDKVPDSHAVLRDRAMEALRVAGIF